MDENLKQKFLDELDKNDKDLSALQEMQRNIFGINSVSNNDLPQPEYIKGTGAKNIEGAVTIFKYAANNGMSLESAQSAVKKWTMAQGASEAEANQIVQKALNIALEG